MQLTSDVYICPLISLLISLTLYVKHRIRNRLVSLSSVDFLIFFFFFLDRSIFENNSFDAIKKEFPSRDLSIRFTIFHYLFFYRIFKFSSVFLRANNVIKLGLETMREFFPVVDNSFFETWKRKMGK